MANLPTCKNETCPRYKTSDEMLVLQERKEDVTFGCRACGGIQVRTLDWRRATQENSYIRGGRPEYARNRAFFFQGRNRTTRSY